MDGRKEETFSAAIQQIPHIFLKNTLEETADVLIRIMELAENMEAGERKKLLDALYETEQQFFYMVTMASYKGKKYVVHTGNAAVLLYLHMTMPGRVKNQRSVQICRILKEFAQGIKAYGTGKPLAAEQAEELMGYLEQTTGLFSCINSEKPFHAALLGEVLPDGDSLFTGYSLGEGRKESYYSQAVISAQEEIRKDGQIIPAEWVLLQNIGRALCHAMDGSGRQAGEFLAEDICSVCGKLWNEMEKEEQTDTAAWIFAAGMAAEGPYRGLTSHMDGKRKELMRKKFLGALELLKK